jgi:hypothetical protein
MNKQRKVFDMTKARVKGTDLEQYALKKGLQGEGGGAGGKGGNGKKAGAKVIIDYIN